MSLILWIVGFLALLLLWRLTWRDRPLVAFGITLGIMIGWVIAASFGPPQLESIPVWLPPLPFAVIAITLFCFGVLAWRWDDEKTDGKQGGKAPPAPLH